LFFFAFANPESLVETPTLSPSSYVSLSLGQIDVSVQDANQITPLSSDVPLEALFKPRLSHPFLIKVKTF
jgi:hypothetical protein